MIPPLKLYKVNFWCDQIWSILSRGRINWLWMYGRTILMKEILKFQGMASLMLPKALVSFLSVSCCFQIRMLWMSKLGAHNLWATSVIMWHLWGHICPPLMVPKPGLSPFCMTWTESSAHMSLVPWKSHFSECHTEERMALWATDTGSACGGLRVMDGIKHISTLGGATVRQVLMTPSNGKS